MIVMQCNKCGQIEEVAHGSGGGLSACTSCKSTEWKIIDDGLVECPECHHRYIPGTWCHGRKL